jgi:hypothetical protein
MAFDIFKFRWQERMKTRLNAQENTSTYCKYIDVGMSPLLPRKKGIAKEVNHKKGRRSPLI